MDLPIPEPLKTFWELWEIRAFILFSMFLQCFLILASPLRKRTASIWLYMSVWSAYLLADWVASFTVGLISSSQSDKSCKKTDINPDIFAFWASFLLVHLGGPDTITAFALEDNELWRRHFLTLVFQCVSASYVFYQSLPNNALWIPTLLMFVSGVIKYGERTYSLYLASLDTFRNNTVGAADRGPNYAKLMMEYSAMKEANLPTSIKMFNQPQEEKSVNKVKEGKLNEAEVVLHAHKFFGTFKGLIVDIILSFRDRQACREFFRNRKPKDAFSVVETELNFMYDVLFTKVPVVYGKFNYSIRFICSSLAITSLGIFYFERKSSFKPGDVIITYTLLLGAISLDVLAFIFLIRSDWHTTTIRELPQVNITNKDKTENGTTHDSQWRRCRRWSETVSTYNLIHYAQRGRSKCIDWLLDKLGCTSLVDLIFYVKRNDFNRHKWGWTSVASEKTNELEIVKEHIFQELKTKSEIADDLETAKELSNAKGEWALQEEGCNDLIQYVLNVDYDQSILLWHIATELCYQNEEADKVRKPKGDNEATQDTEDYRKMCKLLSDYMLYLLVKHPTMMSTVAGIGLIRFKDTCEEACKFFGKDSKSQKEDYCLSFSRKEKKKEEDEEDHKDCWLSSNCKEKMKGKKKDSWFCFKGKEERKEEKKKRHISRCLEILKVPTEVKPSTVKGEKSKSVLFDGCILAKELQKVDKKWKVMSRVWVEMLSYAAINCRATTHAQQLPRGGELLTLVWLLMVQFGLGSQFQLDEGHARAKLTVGK